MDANQLWKYRETIENNHNALNLSLTGLQIDKDEISSRKKAPEKIKNKYYIKTSLDNLNLIYTNVIMYIINVKMNKCRILLLNSTFFQ